MSEETRPNLRTLHVAYVHSVAVRFGGRDGALEAGNGSRKREETFDGEAEREGTVRVVAARSLGVFRVVLIL